MNNISKKKKLYRLITELNNTWDYGVLIDNKRITDVSKVDWTKYRTTPIQKLKHTKIGTCWDFVNYQHHILNSYGITNKNYMIVGKIKDDTDNVITHTFTIADIGNKKYWIESSKWNDRGVHEVKDYEDVVDHFIKTGYIEDLYNVYEYDPDELDKNLTDKQYFDEASRKLVDTNQPYDTYTKIS